MKQIFTTLLILIALHSAAQEIAGKVIDEKKEPMINVAVQVYQGDALKGGSITDFDGNYVIKPLDPGTYKVLVMYVGYDSALVTGVIVSPGSRTSLNVNMRPVKGHALREVTITAYKVPLVNHDSKSTVLTRDQIRRMPTTQVTDLVATSPGVNQQHRGGNLTLSGGRAEGTRYIIDGVVVQGQTGTDMAQGSIDQREVITSGVPAKYGMEPTGQANQADVLSSGVPANYGQAQGSVARFYDPSLPEYKKIQENDFKNVKASPVSTMSVDVDRASYSNVRTYITAGQLPPADAVRLEEMVNYFNYDYPQPKGKDPIAIQTELTTCPWQGNHQLLHIGIQALKVNTEDLPPSNLVFLVDVSGSMDSPERLPLIIEAMKLLTLQLRAIDKVSIVTYAGNAGLALPPTNGNKKQQILDALDRLRAGGSTAGGAGIKLAYKIAEDNFIEGGNNRVLLATDGDFNVGVSSDNELEELITKERATGVYLTCLGVGTDNYKDAKMEMMADKGNGNYDYLDNLMEAQKTLVSEFGGTLFTVAKDVKAQIEFNPAKVQGYRLIGYEDRLLNTEDFKDDKKDAGDMGSGHTVTVMYELIPTGLKCDDVRPTDELKYQAPATTAATNSDELATIKFRYKKPHGEKSTEMTHVIADNTTAFEEASENTRFSAAVAMFGMLLRESAFKGSSRYADVIKIANKSKGTDKDGYRTEFVQLVKSAITLDKKTARR